MRLTVSDKNTLKSIIIDEIVEANDKIIASDQLQEEAEKLANKQLEPYLSKYKKLSNQQDSINDELGKLSDKIFEVVEKLTGEKIYTAGYGNNRFVNLPNLVDLEKRKLEIKYKLIPTPKESDVEKLIVKSSCKDYQDPINSIVTLISKGK